jgi:carbonic anhydrase
MDRLFDGIARFQRDIFPQQEGLFNELAGGQHPHTLFITCADSRINPTLITQTEPGELFVCRNAGNMVPPYGELHGGVSATIEYAAAVLQVGHIVVCGHSDCGAMKGLLHPESVEQLPAVRSWLDHGAAARWIVKENFAQLPEEQVLPTLTEQNVLAQLTNLATHPSVAARLQRGAVVLHGWVYHIKTGRIDVYSRQTGRFAPIQREAA